MKRDWFTLFIASILLIWGCEDGPREDAVISPIWVSGEVRSVDGEPIRGVVALERGELYSKEYRWGGWVKDGSFSVQVPEEGDYGLHVYATGYIYHPVGIRVERGRENAFEFTVPPNPAPEDAPSVSEVRFAEGEDERAVLIRLKAVDPNENLSHQVLGVNPRRGVSRMFAPDGFVFPWTRDYPNGEYVLSYRSAETGAFDREEWIFLAADNRCYTSPLLVHPYGPQNILASHVGKAGDAEADPGEAKDDLSRLERGRRIFDDNCAVCHHPDSTETKVGPGLEGLFQREKTPVEGVPVTEENIRRRIEAGGEKMPPYSHIRGRQRDALLEYLKSL